MPAETIRIRPLSLVGPDLAQLIEIDQACFAEEAYQIEDFEWAYRRCFELSIVAEIAAQIAGYMMTCPLPTKGHIYSLAVAPAYQRSGIGKALFLYTEHTLSDLGIKTIELEVKKTNKAGRAFWRQMGFTAWGTIPDFYPDGEAALRMRKLIEAG